MVNTGEAVVRMLKNEGVEVVFGIIDGTYFGFYSKLQKYGIKLITPRHETSAVHMAGTYARLTGKIGVCMASNGPGVANVLPGVAVENAEGNRVILITSSRRPQITDPDRGGTYQYFNHNQVIRPISKYSETVRFPERTLEIMKQAFRKSYQGRPGVVHIDIPENIINGKFKFDESEFLMPYQYRRIDPIKADLKQINKAVELLTSAKFPIIHAGSGVIHSEAYQELKKVSEILHAPVTTSWAARSVLSEENDLAVSMIHVDLNDQIRKKADLVLVLGSRLGETDWWGKAPNWASSDEQKIIQVDIDEEFIGRNRPVELGIFGDIKVFLEDLYTELEKNKNNINISERKNMFKSFIIQKDKNRAKLNKHLEDDSSPMNSSHISTICNRIFRDNSIVIFDGGNTAIWGHFFHNAKVPGTVISTPKMGMLGAGVSQALGAAVAFPERQVYCIIGDGAMGFHPQEIETAVRNNLRVIYLVLCDKQWGMVKMNQQFALKPFKTMIKKELDKSETINADLNEIEFDLLAKSMGAHGERVNRSQDLPNAIKKSIDSGKCSVIHVDVNNVKHMWAPSLITFKKMHEEPAGK